MKRVITLLFIVACAAAIIVSIVVSVSKVDISTQLKSYVQKSDAEIISVYVQDLSTKKEYGYNQDLFFTPASMFKVPTVMAYMKKAESEPELLNKKITYTQELATAYNSKSIVQYPEISDPVTIGKTYTASDLIVRTIQNSDNQALILLKSTMTPDDFSGISESTGIVIHDINKEAHTFSYFQASNLIPYTTPMEYMKLFTSLENASYLMKGNSDGLLAMLNQSNFKNGLVAGVPQGVLVAHKFGVYGVNTAEGKSEVGLNDCGIVYATNPYNICVMLVAKDQATAESILKDLSSQVYAYLK